MEQERPEVGEAIQHIYSMKKDVLYINGDMRRRGLMFYFLMVIIVLSVGLFFKKTFNTVLRIFVIITAVATIFTSLTYKNSRSILRSLKIVIVRNMDNTTIRFYLNGICQIIVETDYPSSDEAARDIKERIASIGIKKFKMEIEKES